ncbi:hypothetical protein KU43P_13690 [Pseudomonas sp. KU43P]|nr:hypothetical protein KU43P_13690 [Pseudomonas sp. KU43P]
MVIQAQRVVTGEAAGLLADEGDFGVALACLCQVLFEHSFECLSLRKGTALRMQGDLMLPDLKCRGANAQLKPWWHGQAQAGKGQFVAVGNQWQRSGTFCQFCGLQGRFSSGVTFRLFPGRLFSGFTLF